MRIGANHSQSGSRDARSFAALLRYAVANALPSQKAQEEAPNPH
jgi:hypothetical protein